MTIPYAAEREAKFLVKFVGLPHTANKWVAESKLLLMAKRKLINFKRRHESPCNFLDPAWTIPERLIARRCAPNEPGWQVLVKWTNQGYESCTWVVSRFLFEILVCLIMPLDSRAEAPKQKAKLPPLQAFLFTQACTKVCRIVE